jgi:hypothetical protein
MAGLQVHNGTEMVPVPLDHSMIRTARAIGLCLGD